MRLFADIVADNADYSPDYLARRGTPRTIEDLAGHEMIGFASSRTGQVLPLEFMAGENPKSLGLTGLEVFDFEGLAQGFEPRKKIKVNNQDREVDDWNTVIEGVGKVAAA